MVVKYLDCFGNITLPADTTLDSWLEMVSIKQAIFSENGTLVNVADKMWWEINSLNYDVKKINFKSAYTFSGSEQGVAISNTEKYAIHAADDFNQGCTIQDTLITNCVIQYLDSLATGSFNLTDAVTFEYQDIVLMASTASFGSVYFAGGTVKFKVNNWTGSLLYTATDKPPTYTATDGVQNIQGTLVIN